MHPYWRNGEWRVPYYIPPQRQFPWKWLAIWFVILVLAGGIAFGYLWWHWIWKGFA